MKFKEIKNLSEKELKATLLELRDKLRALRFEAAAKKLRDSSEIKKSRRDIARILTILTSSGKTYEK